MPMIQGIDGGLLINALRQGREDRYVRDQRDLQAAQQQAAQAKQEKVQGLTRQALGGGPAQQGVMEQYSAGAGVAETQGMAPARPMPTAQPDPQALNELLALDPEMYSKVAGALKTMDDASVKKYQVRNDAMGSAAFYLQKVPPQQRKAALQRLAPQLMQAGWSAEELNAAELSDEALFGMRAMGIDLDKAIDNDLKEREFRMGKTVPLVPGGGMATVRPVMDAQGNMTGSKAETLIEPYGGMEAPEGNIATPKSKQDYEKLPPGSQYRDPNGVLRTKPGGASGNASGDFRPVGVPGETISSGYRDPAHNKRVGGVPGSYHTRKGKDGQAMARDSIPPPGMSMAAYASELQRRNPHLEVINEGDHVHMEPR